MLPPRRELPKLTDRLPLGTSGLEVSPICQGMTWEPRTVPAAFEAGINFFFVTADMHWPLYEGLRRGLRDLLDGNPAARDSIVVGVVAYVTQPEFTYAPFLEVLEEISPLQRIDLLIAGGAYGHEIGDRIEVYKARRDSGLAGARAIGTTFHDREAVLDVLHRGGLDIAYVRYNPGHSRARTDLFQHVKSRAEGRTTLLYNFKSTSSSIKDEAEYAALGLAPDDWRPHITDYYRFALTEPALDGILCSLPGKRGVRELSDALARGPLDDEAQQYLMRLSELKRRRDSAPQQP
jgi:hypothetical protein